jgi:hypothetical protein
MARETEVKNQAEEKISQLAALKLELQASLSTKYANEAKELARLRKAHEMKVWKFLLSGTVFTKCRLLL